MDVGQFSVTFGCGREAYSQYKYVECSALRIDSGEWEWELRTFECMPTDRYNEDTKNVEQHYDGPSNSNLKYMRV